jgi:hypothetical protein
MGKVEVNLMPEIKDTINEVEERLDTIRRKTNRLRLLSGMFFKLMGVLAGSFTAIYLIKYYLGSENVGITFVLIITGVTGLAVTATGLLGYLDSEPDSSERKVKTVLDKKIEKLASDVAIIRASIRELTSTKIDMPTLAEDKLLAILRETISISLSQEAFKAIDEELLKRQQKAQEIDSLVLNFDAIRDRLIKETGNLSRRANLNLVIGFLTTLGAGGLLLYLVFRLPLDLAGIPKEEYLWRILAHYLPRFFTIVFIEIFAFFFLRLYKSGLSDIKYYQNELSNVELKLASLKAALAIDDAESTKLVIAELSKTERNFVLKSGETTIELEKLKTEKGNMKYIVEQIASIIKTKAG